MREIKFRAWDNVKKEMFFSIDTAGSLIDFFTHFREIHDGYGRAHLMQFTGLLDKNGKEIYEGDIILRKGLEIAYEIQWINQSGGWFLVHKDMRMPLSAMYLSIMYLSIMEIIGNIYENPELLNGIVKGTERE